MLHVMALGKLGVRTLRKAVADRSILRVIGIGSHTEGRRQFLDLLRSRIAGLLEDPASQPAIQPAIKVEHLSQRIKAPHKTFIDILLDILDRRLVRHYGVPGKDQDRVVDADGDLRTAERRLILQKLAVFQLCLFPKALCGLVVIVPVQELLDTLLRVFRVKDMFAYVI